MRRGPQTVVYLGANVDEFTQAESIGVLYKRTRGWTPTDDGARIALSHVSRATTRNLASRQAPPETFWDEDEEATDRTP